MRNLQLLAIALGASLAAAGAAAQDTPLPRQGTAKPEQAPGDAGTAPGATSHVEEQQEVPPAGALIQIAPGMVKRVEQALRERGYAVGAPDGNWTEETEAALRQFQQAQGLQASGDLTVPTARALGVRPGPAEEAAGGRQGEQPVMGSETLRNGADDALERTPRSRPEGASGAAETQ